MESGEVHQNIFPPALVHLTGHRTWINWTAGPVGPDGSFDKIPCDGNGNAISMANPANLQTYETARNAVVNNRLVAGVALASIGNDGSWLVLDLDKCRDVVTGEIAPWALGIAEAAQSYCEVSPSGRGLRIIGAADGWDVEERQRRWYLGEDAHRGGYGGQGETFYKSGFATITFNVLPGTEGLWSPLGALARSLPRRLSDRDKTDSDRGLKHVANEDPTAPIEVIRETLGYLPNDQAWGRQSWDWWSDVGMCVFRASEGSAEGLDAWLAWSLQHPVYGSDGSECAERWDHWTSSSPPTRCGFATILHEARNAQSRMGVVGWTGGEKWKAYAGEGMAKRSQEAALAMGAIPVGEKQAGGQRESSSDGRIAGYMGGDSGETGPVVALGQVLHRTTIATYGVTLAELVKVAEGALADSGYPIMQRGGRLVRPAMLEVDTFDGRRTVATVLIEFQKMGLLKLLSEVADWLKLNGKGEPVKCDPPDKIAAIILEDAGNWPFPVVHGTSGIPVVRSDGTLAMAAGLDRLTGIYVLPDPEVDFEIIRGVLGRNDLGVEAAAEACGVLEELLVGFPFVRDEDRSVALSAMLTPLCRFGMKVAPAHMFNAPLPGTGKSYLASTCAALTLGRAPYVFSAGKDEAEMDKRLGGALIAGNMITVLDNMNSEIYGEFLSQMIEQESLQVRPLGASNVMQITNRSCVSMTGNNVSVTRDLVRKVLECLLDANMDSPERRRFATRPMDMLMKDRGRYLVAAYTLVCAHARAGFPGVEGEAVVDLASFGGWGRLVRGAIIWAGRADPVATTERTRAQDPDRLDLSEFIEAWVERFGVGKAAGGVVVSQECTVSELVAATQAVGLNSPGIVSGESDAQRKEWESMTVAGKRLNSILMKIAPGANGQGINPIKIAHWLRRHVGHMSGSWKLVRGNGDSHSQKATWSVINVRFSVVK